MAEKGKDKGAFRLGSTAERNLIALILREPERVDAMALHPRAFASPFNQEIWRIAVDLDQSDCPVTYTAIVDRGRDFEIRGVNLEDHAQDILSLKSPDVVAVDQLCEEVKGDYARRTLIARTAHTLGKIKQVRDPKKALYYVQALCDSSDELMPSGVEKGAEQLDLFVDDVVRMQSEKNAGHDASFFFRTGVQTIDEAIGGFPRNTMAVIKAKSGHGKSTLINQILLNQVLRFDVPALTYSLEDGTGTIMRHLANISGVPLKTLLDLELTDQDEILIKRAREKFKGKHFWTRYVGGINAYDIIVEARKLKRKHGLKVVFVDYLTKLKKTNPKQSEYECLKEAAMLFDASAREDEINYVVASQVTKQRDQTGSLKQGTRKGYEPKSDNIRGCGDVEHFADCIVEVYQPLKGQEPEPSVECHILKIKNGQCGTYEFASDLSRMRLD